MEGKTPLNPGRYEIELTRTPFLIVISGPSGVGKSTVVREVLTLHNSLYESISVTTRKPRKGEKQGVDYDFISIENFNRLREEGKLLEWAEVYGNFYGTPRSSIEEALESNKNVLLEIDVQGGMIIKKKVPAAVLVFLLPPSLEALKERLTGRSTDSQEVISRRLEYAGSELKCFDKYDYIVVNDDLKRCTENVMSIIEAESMSRKRTEVDIDIDSLS